MGEEEYIMWNSFSDHVMDMMKELMNQHDFADVTLISEDKKTFKAHRNILSAFSPFFKDILQVDASRTPLIFLKGVGGIELQSILHFIYLGNATFSHDRINDLILSANILEIKGLSDFELENKDHYNPLESQVIEEENATVVISEDPKELSMKDKPCIIPEEKVKNTDDDETHARDTFDDTVDNVIVGMDFNFSDHVNPKTQFPTQDQSPEALNGPVEKESDIKETGNNKIVPGIKNNYKTEGPNSKSGKEVKCKKCDKVLKSKKVLSQHMRVHKDYSCHLCDHKALTQQAYDKHMSYKHNLNFNCFMCDFKAEEHRQLREHYESTHEGKKEYKCTKCDYTCKTSTDLGHHKITCTKNKIKCDMCPFQASFMTTLRKHMMHKHVLPQSEVNEILSKL